MSDASSALAAALTDLRSYVATLTPEGIAKEDAIVIVNDGRALIRLIEQRDRPDPGEGQRRVATVVEVLEAAFTGTDTSTLRHTAQAILERLADAKATGATPRVR